MKETRIPIDRAGIHAISQILEQFKNVERFHLVYGEGGGIGYTIDMVFDTDLNGVNGSFVVPIVGVDSW